MRLSAIPDPRCPYGLNYGSLSTRCMFKPGHNGPHEGKGLRKFTYQRVRWFAGDGREFITERNDEFSWSEKRSKP